MRKLYGVAQNLWKKEPCRWLITICVAALLGVAAGRTVIGSVSGSVSVVDGVSMVPTYQPGARVYTGPIASVLQRGDIVLIDDHEKDYALKRIVGMSGEKVELWRGYVFINGRMLIEPYLPKYTYTFPDERTETYIFRLRDDQYFLLGDNRPYSEDSRHYGPVERKQIKSRVPWPASALRAHLSDHTLPAEGKRTIQWPSE